MNIDSLDLQEAATALRRYRCILPEGHPDRDHANELANRLAIMARTNAEFVEADQQAALATDQQVSLAGAEAS